MRRILMLICAVQLEKMSRPKSFDRHGGFGVRGDFRAMKFRQMLTRWWLSSGLVQREITPLSLRPSASFDSM